MRNLVSNTSWVFMGSSIERASVLVSSIIIANGLSVSAYASYSFFLLTVTMFTAIFAVGAGVYSSKLFARFKLGEYCDIGLLWVLTVISSLLAVILLFILNLYNILSVENNIPLIFYLFTIFFLIINIVPAGGIVGLAEFKRSFYLSVFLSIVLVAGAIYSNSHKSLFIASFVYLLYALFLFMGNSIIVSSHIKYEDLLKNLRFNLKNVYFLVYSIWPLAIVSAIAGSAMWFIGKIIMNDLGSYSFAVFSIGLQWYAVALFIPAIFSKAFFSFFIKSANEETSNSYRERVKKVIIGILLFSFFLDLIFLFLSKYLILLYGSNYSQESLIISLFVFSAIFFSPINFMNNILTSSDFQIYLPFLYVVWFLTITSLAYSATTFGLIGVSIAIAVGNLIIFVMNYIILKRLMLL